MIWNDALREACVSGDRLFAFVRQLSGVIHEQVDAVCVIDENLLVQHQNKLRDRRSRIAERAAQEHMQLVKADPGIVASLKGLSAHLAAHALAHGVSDVLRVLELLMHQDQAEQCRSHVNHLAALCSASLPKMREPSSEEPEGKTEKIEATPKPLLKELLGQEVTVCA